MNEVTTIHLSRQAFTISIDAHHELKKYLDAIQDQVDDKEVVEEIELRMAELLTEHGITPNKVILPADIDFLKEQLGRPTDFKDDANEVSNESKTSENKRLFRDTNNAILAGVAAGLAKYFGFDVLLVRLVLVALILITFGWGVLLYIVLWLLVPEAKSSSERLLMLGRPVTVDSLKEMVEHADVKGAASRANATLAGPINTFFHIILKIIGLIIVLLGLSILFGLLTGGTYFLSREGSWLQYNIFPIGLREHLLLDIVVAIIGLIAVLIILSGVAIFQRKWPIHTWITGVLIGLAFIGLAIGGALGADVYPSVHARYEANIHTSTRYLPHFNSMVVDSDIGIYSQTATSYYVVLNYYGHPNLSTIKTSVKDGVLTINGYHYNDNRNCQALCIPSTHGLSITVYSPDNTQSKNQDVYGSAPPFTPPVPSPPTEVK